jgi:hypothetical protein
MGHRFVAGSLLMVIARAFRRWVLLSAITASPLLSVHPDASAQSTSMSPFASSSVAGSNQPAQVLSSADPSNFGPDRGTQAAGTSTGNPPARSVLEIVLASLVDDLYSDDAKARWTPLYLREYFTEGWDTPFILAPSSSAGAPRQGWIGAFDGQFFRTWFSAFAYDQGVNSHIGNGYVGRYTIFAPLNRRLEFQWDSFFIVSNKGGTSNTYHGNIGDQTFWLKTLLCETKNFGYGTGLGINVPTGRTENGQGANYLQPGFRFLWFPFGGTWMIRGETGGIIPLASTGYTQYQNVLGIGRYFPGLKDSWFQQVWFYAIATQTSTITGTPRRETLFTLQPGIRFKIPSVTLGTGLWYFLANVNIPMTGPHAFSYQPIFAILYDY